MHYFHMRKFRLRVNFNVQNYVKERRICQVFFTCICCYYLNIMVKFKSVIAFFNCKIIKIVNLNIQPKYIFVV